MALSSWSRSAWLLFCGLALSGCIVDMDAVTDVPVALVVELETEIRRLPDDSRERTILGIGVPLVSIDAMTASAASKVALALDRLGLKF